MIKDDLLKAVRAGLVAIGVDSPPSAVSVERPANLANGDWSTNAALVCAKLAGRNPRELGQALAAHLMEHRPGHVERIDVAGPGFVNFTLAPTWLHQILQDVVAGGLKDYARLNHGEGKAINVEFVSSNPTGPLHAGGGRWAAYGDSLCRILARCGFEPHREFYVNDRGRQTELFGQSLAARKAGLEPPEGGYVGEYVSDWAAEMPDGVDPGEWGKDRALSEVKDSLASMHVEFDSWSSEKALVDSGAMQSALAELEQAGHVYESDGAIWLRTSDFVESEDRVLIRSDGEPSYFLPDIAYHRDKFNRGSIVVDVLGADHHGYMARMKSALMALGHAEADYEVIIGQNVKLVKDGVELKLSKRAGNMVLVSDLVDEVGPDVARFAYLLQSIDTPQTIDIDVLKQRAMENPVYYVQYAHARIHSIGRKAAERGVERLPLADVELGLLVHPRELEILRLLGDLPDVLEGACNDRAPHRVTTWVRDLASAYHGFQHDCPVLRADVDSGLAQARLWLVEAARIGTALGLDLLGVEAPEEM